MNPGGPIRPGPPPRRSVRRGRSRGGASFRILLFLAAFPLAAFTGCASHLDSMEPVCDALCAGDVPVAVERFEAVRMKNSDLLYLFERGVLLHIAGRYTESNDAFEVAEFVAEDLYTRSLSREALALMTSDRTLPYHGARYELDMIPYYRALNYLALNLPGEALVEARKADYRLAQREGDHDPDRAAVPAFLNYFTGLLYESEGEANDAVVSFREALRLYAAAGIPPPPRLAEDYFASADYLGMAGEIDSLTAADPDVVERSREHNADDLVIFVESGFVPHREPVDIVLPVFDTKSTDAHASAGLYVDRYGHDIYAWRAGRAELDHVLRFAFPQLVDRPSPVASVRVLLPDGTPVESAEALDLSSAAHAEFRDRVPGILLKTVARALAKETLRKKAKKKDEGLGILMNIVSVATEQADTRGGLLLPGRIDVLKARMPEEGGRITIRFLDTRGVIVEEGYLDVPPTDGRTHFVSARSFR